MEKIKLFGIDEFWKDIGIGFLIGLGFILINVLAPSIAIGFPVFPQATALVTILSASLIAPLMEEFAFRGGIQWISYRLTSFKLSSKASLAMAVIITAVSFSAWHYFAYGASLSAMNASFIGAFVFSIIASLAVLYTRNILTAIIPHIMFNTFLVSSYFLIIAGGF